MSRQFGGQYSMFSGTRKAAWQQLAHHIGGEFIDGELLGRDSVMATHRIWTIRLEHYRRPSLTYSGGNDYTQLTASYVSPDRFTWWVQNRDLGVWIGDLPGLKQLGNLFGLPKVEVGEPDFDSRFVTAGSNPEQVAALFASPEMRRLLQLQPKIYLDSKRRGRRWEATDFELGFQESGTILNFDRLRGLFELFKVTLDQLVAIGSASDDSY